MFKPAPFLGLGAGALIASLAAFALAAPPAPKPAAAAAQVWAVDKAASRLTFRASANGVAFDGVFKTWDAQIAFDPKNLKASHAVVSVSTASAVTGDPTRDQMLPTADWFNVGKFAKATFVTTSITETSPDHYVANGTLTLHGVSKPLALPFTLTIVKDVAKMDGSATIDRTQFGLGQGQAGGTDTVAAQVSIGVKLMAKKGR
jgi:polyisoprenoid-binding protein YceI